MKNFLFKERVSYKKKYHSAVCRKSILEGQAVAASTALETAHGNITSMLEANSKLQSHIKLLDGQLVGVRDELGRKVNELTGALESREAIAQVSKINNEERAALSVLNQKLTQDRNALAEENESLIADMKILTFNCGRGELAEITLHNLKDLYLVSEKELDALITEEAAGD
jgi:hypothetical protein